MQNVLLFAAMVFALAFAPAILSAPVFASEHGGNGGAADSSLDGAVDQNGVSDGAGELTDEERRLMLTRISAQLEEVERELMRLSLIVQKIALEQQALALQELVEQKIAENSGTAVQEDEPALGDDAGTVAQGESFDQADGEGGREQFSAGSALENENAQGDRDENKERGFLAALGPIGNLGTPERAALAILIFLLAFIFMRRVRGRKAGLSRAKSVPTSTAQPSSQSFSSQTQPSVKTETLQAGREDLKERVAWE